MANEVLGVDVGGVIISHTDIKGSYPPLPNVFKTLRILREKKFGSNIFTVSHADSYLESKMIEWLWDRKFFNMTGISVGNIYFCRKRNEKVVICKKLGITHFIDDRKEILTYLHNAGIKNLYLFQGREEEVNSYMDVLPHVIQVASWSEVAKQLLK